MNCEEAVKKNLGISRCTEFPEMPRSILTVPPGFSGTLVEVATKEFWQAKLLAPIAERCYLWDYFVKHEDISEEAQYEDTAHAMLAIRDGNYRFRFHFRVNLCKHKAMYTHRANNGGVLIFDNKRKLLGTLNAAETNLLALDVQLLHTEKIKFNDGSVSSTSPILLALNDNLQVDQSGVQIDFSFINELIRLTDAELTVVGNPTASSIVVDVKTKCDGTGVTGLLLADFLPVDTDGDAIVLSSATPHASIAGRYTLASAAAFEGGMSLGTRPPSTLTAVGFEIFPIVVAIA